MNNESATEPPVGGLEITEPRRIIPSLGQKMNLKAKYFSWLGLIVCGIYLTILSLCLYGAMNAGADYKGEYVLFQIPIALQLALIDAIGLAGYFEWLGWLSAYLIIVPPTLFILYVVFYVFERGILDYYRYVKYSNDRKNEIH